jgi:hypothetical protein
VIPGSLGVPTLSKLYVDGIPLDALNTAVSANQTFVAAQHELTDQAFFSTPMRPNGDSTRDVFEVSLSIPQAVNRVQFALAHFPQRSWLQYFDQATMTWITFTQTNNLTTTMVIEDSIPQVISSGVNDNSHLHPQHFGASHWTPYDFKIRPVIASRFRVVMSRPVSENIPLTNFGNPVDYSLGVRDFNIGYLVASRDDLPNSTRSSDTLTEREAIGTSMDLLGSSVEYVVRENRASDLLTTTGALWKSGPQPIADSVVCLYVDARDSQGAAQVVDRFYLDPLHTGCTANIYYSPDIPDPAVFSAAEVPLSFPLTRPVGATIPQPLPEGILFPTTPSFLDLDNRAVQFNPTKPFQFHGMFQPQFPASSTTPAVFYDDGVLAMSWGPDPTGAAGGVFRATLGSMAATWAGLTFDFNARLVFTITFDGNLLVMESPHGRVESMSGEITPGTQLPDTLRIGGSQTATPETSVPGSVRVLSLMIKQGNPDDDAAKALYWSNPSAYVMTPQFHTEGPHTTDNAILRYDPSQQTPGQSSINPYGFLGGPGVVYENIRWTPIARDYVLKKGFFNFDPTKARFFKFEFSNLSAEPFESDHPVVLTTKVFSGLREATTSPGRATAQSSNNGGSGMSVNTSISSINRFEDQNRLTASGSAAVTPTSLTTYLPTEALRVMDLQGAARMEGLAPYWNFSKFQSGSMMDRFEQSERHYYENVSVIHTKRVAYFVGLRGIRMYRINRQLADDQDQYTELFLDAQDLLYNPTINSWALGDGQISTTSTLAAPVTLTSKPYASFRAIQAVQFASTQSPAKQLLIDPDFDDVSLQYWQPIGDAETVPDPFFNTDVGSLVRVTRGGNPVTWSSMETSFATWNLLEDSDPNPYLPTWDTIEGSTSPTATGGIQSFQSIQPSSIGKLYAAARVIAPATLNAPLVLRLVNGDGTILAEKPMNVLANQITEWFVEYDIGTSSTPAGTHSWDFLETGNTWTTMEALGTWNDVANIVAQIEVHDVQVSLSQDFATADVFYVDNISIFNDAILWEFSRDSGQTWWPAWDIRNDPHGAFVFPDGDQSVPGGGSQFVWRVTGAASDLSVSALQVRFWFDSLMMGIPFNRTLQHGGPNLTPLDQYPDVTDDPMFKAWHGAIPQDWWYIYRQWVRLHAATPSITQRAFLPDTLPVGVDEGSPAAPSYSVMPTSLVRRI